MRRKLSLHRAISMTIDMHRDPSLRKSLAFALFDSRDAPILLPSDSDLSSYTATRNLPSHSLSDAINIMEETLSPSESHNPKPTRRARRHTNKPALCYTVYWECDWDESTQLSRIDDSLTMMFATHLQTLIVGRSDYPRRTHVILNVIDPSTQRLRIVRYPYFELMSWHLTTICDEYSTEALARGKAATTRDSLRRQDHRLLDLPPLFSEAVRGVPGYHFDSNTLHMVWRAGPSTFHTSDFIDTVHANIHFDETLQRKARTSRLEPDALNKHINHKRDTRRKLVIGAYFDKCMDDNESMAEDLRHDLDDALSDAFDRSLFSLDTLSSRGASLLCNFYPKKYKREWCAAYRNDPAALPDDLIGQVIQIEPHPPNAPWYGRVTEVAVRTADKLIVRTTPRDYTALYRDGWRTVAEAPLS